MNDSVIFMSAYRATHYTRNFCPFVRKKDVKNLFKKYHISYFISDKNILSATGSLKLKIEYDIFQKTKYSYLPLSAKQSLSDFKDLTEKNKFYIGLLHSYNILADPTFFKMGGYINMESFLVHIGDQFYQIDPQIFTLNQTLIIAFEVIDCSTGEPLSKNQVLGLRENYNLLLPKGVRFFDEKDMMPSDMRISEIIYRNVNSFFTELCGRRLETKEHLSVDDVLVLSEQIENTSKYLCDLIGVTELQPSIMNISTTNNYCYYPQDGVSIITTFSSENSNIALYNGIVLESIKLSIYLFQRIVLDIDTKMNEIIKNDIYLESLFLVPNLPIETHNLLDYIYLTKSFQYNKKAIKLKLSYMTIKNEYQKNRNAALLNVLIFFVSLLGTIGTLETLENRFNIPFNSSLIVVLVIFSFLGIAWFISEYKQNRHF